MFHQYPFGNTFRLKTESPEEMRVLLNHEVEVNLDEYGVGVKLMPQTNEVVDMNKKNTEN